MIIGNEQQLAATALTQNLIIGDGEVVCHGVGRLNLHFNWHEFSITWREVRARRVVRDIENDGERRGESTILCHATRRVVSSHAHKAIATPRVPAPAQYNRTDMHILYRPVPAL